MIRCFFARFLRRAGSVLGLLRLSARMIPMRGNMVSPPCSTTNINASMAVSHSGASCSALGRFAIELAGITQGAQLAAIRQRNGIVEGAVPALGWHHVSRVAFVAEQSPICFGRHVFEHRTTIPHPGH